MQGESNRPVHLLNVGMMCRLAVGCTGCKLLGIYCLQGSMMLNSVFKHEKLKGMEIGITGLVWFACEASCSSTLSPVRIGLDRVPTRRQPNAEGKLGPKC